MFIDAQKVSNENFVAIFHQLDKKSLVNCMLACRRFHQLTLPDSFWVKYSRIQGISKVLPPLKWRRAAWHKKFEGNEDGSIDTSTFNFNFKQMVSSGYGFSPIPAKFMRSFEQAEDNTIDGLIRTDDFTISADWCGLRMETGGGFGCQPHPDVSNCIAFTCSLSGILVYVDLVAAGVPEWVLDYVRPKIRICQKINHRRDCGASLQRQPILGRSLWSEDRQHHCAGRAS